MDNDQVKFQTAITATVANRLASRMIDMLTDEQIAHLETLSPGQRTAYLLNLADTSGLRDTVKAEHDTVLKDVSARRRAG